ncbi:hypothetical protein PR202_gb26934 [Eleusine coracana subsp. coracana]|uniref:Hydroxyproline O-arabinosyltransferase-like domain-containing protein n=1 Tax=Eleusine coracana subsp. coracana TaxID=191504 RepID=A0AAV5FQ91_ELECO|nr:hypothetical protein PR202_gb26934 [Eleusine coracana subsp. coracana]
MNAAARKPWGGAGGTGRGPALVLALVAAGAFLISYNFFAMVFRGSGPVLWPAAAGNGRDPVVAMPASLRTAAGDAARRRPFHVALTATDAAYSRWQCRVMYFWYKRMQARPGGEAMGGFTRVLHSGKPDGLMDEIPTFVVDPLPAGKDHGYVVLNRPWAFVQWLQKAKIKEEYGYAVASALHGVQHILRKDFMIQPPFDTKLQNTFIIHFTYGNDYSLKGELTYGKIGEWRFDKRSYDDRPPPRNLTLPPPGVPESVVTLVKMVNEASANLPRWDEGI